MNDQTLPQTTDPTPESPRMLVLGHIGAVHGVRGWVKVHSETDPIENVLRYRPWHLHGPGLR